jgi:hypothetical protein
VSDVSNGKFDYESTIQKTFSLRIGRDQPSHPEKRLGGSGKWGLCLEAFEAPSWNEQSLPLPPTHVSYKFVREIQKHFSSLAPAKVR